MKLRVWLTVMSTVFFIGTKAQVKIGDNPNSYSPGSILELESTNKALTLPRLTTVQMQSIPSPLSGMIIFNTDSNCIYLYKNNNVWASISVGGGGSNTTWPYHSNNLSAGSNGNGQGIVSLTGIGLTASGGYSHAEGKNNVAYGNYAWSSGYADTAAGDASVAMGYQNKTTGLYSFSTGFQNVTAYQSAVALGQENRDTGWSSLAMGLRNKIFSGVSYSNALGYSNEIRSGNSGNVFGESNILKTGSYNTASGIGNTIDGSYNQLFGKNNKTLGGNGHFAGGENNTINNGIDNTLFGYNNTAEGNYLGAIGKENTVYFQSAVALGQLNKDSGYASIAGGLSNVINKNVQYASSFGYNNISARNISLNATVPGAATFNAGVANYNTGYASIALGSYNKPSNLNSLAANYNSLSNSFAMSAFGHYNDTLSAYQGSSFLPSEMLFAIGNGTNNTNRRNSFTMMRNGFTTINATSENGANEPRAELDIKGTGAVIVPVGTSAQRPATPVAGMIRFCTDCTGGPVLQGFDGTNWVNL
jgi:hypothetical protein